MKHIKLKNNQPRYIIDAFHFVKGKIETARAEADSAGLRDEILLHLEDTGWDGATCLDTKKEKTRDFEWFHKTLNKGETNAN